MDPKFVTLTERLEPLSVQLRTMAPVAWEQIPRKSPVKGIYVFGEQSKHLYIGRSNDIRRRYKEHTLPGSRINDAPFAVLLTRETTGINPAYGGDFVRKKLHLHQPFMAAFKEAKQRISLMEFRYVEESDPIRQTLLEVYCAIVMETRYNSFEVS